MPTADDYWRAARDFDNRARDVLGEAPPLDASMTDEVVRGGRLRSVLDEAIDAVVRGIGATADGFAAIAEECRRRAIACQDYTSALASYRHADDEWESTPLDERGPSPRPPNREPWMHAG